MVNILLPRSRIFHHIFCLFISGLPAAMMDRDFTLHIITVFSFFPAGCVNLARDEEPTVERVCRELNPDQHIITLFSENYVPVNCRSSLEGVWQFAYQVC